MGPWLGEKRPWARGPMACQKQGPRPDWAPHGSKWDFEASPRQVIASRSRFRAWFGVRGWEAGRNIWVSGPEFPELSHFLRICTGMVRNGLGRPGVYYLEVRWSKKLKKNT